jgi:cobalt-zinc-cadmium efflux system protein
MAVALLILRSAWMITKQSAHILMEGAPHRLKPDAIRADLIDHIPGVEDVHHIHLWSLTQERHLVTLHARIQANTDPDESLASIKARLVKQFGVEHVTVQIEKKHCAE